MDFCLVDNETLANLETSYHMTWTCKKTTYQLIFWKKMEII